jgi:mono/diheme cytochrome c family protein
MKYIAVLCATSLAVGSLAAFAQPPADSGQWVVPARAAARKNPITANETSVALGRKIYERQCISCHGPKGQGDGRAAKKLPKRPGDLSSTKLWEQSDGALLWKLTEGHKPMPTFKDLMSDEERWPVIIYVRTLAPKPGAPDQPKEGSKP